MAFRNGDIQRPPPDGSESEYWFRRKSLRPIRPVTGVAETGHDESPLI
jgi:hypothetical protein